MSAYARKYCHIVADLLLKRDDLTHETLINLGCGWRLAAVVHYLRGKGWPIETHKDMHRVAHYRLPAGWTPKALETPKAS